MEWRESSEVIESGPSCISAEIRREGSDSVFVCERCATAISLSGGEALSGEWKIAARLGHPHNHFGAGMMAPKESTIRRLKLPSSTTA